MGEIITPKRFGENLKKILAKKEMTQKELAERAGVAEGMMGHYTHGRHLPRLDTAHLLAGILGCSLDELLK